MKKILTVTLFITSIGFSLNTFAFKHNGIKRIFLNNNQGEISLSKLNLSENLDVVFLKGHDNLCERCGSSKVILNNDLKIEIKGKTFLANSLIFQTNSAYAYEKHFKSDYYKYKKPSKEEKVFFRKYYQVDAESLWNNANSIQINAEEKTTGHKIKLLYGEHPQYSPFLGPLLGLPEAGSLDFLYIGSNKQIEDILNATKRRLLQKLVLSSAINDDGSLNKTEKKYVLLKKASEILFY